MAGGFIPRPRTPADIDRDIIRHAWMLELAIARYQMDAALLATARINQLLDERLTVRLPV